MKLYKPLFSLVLVLIQFILSLYSHFRHLDWKKELEKNDPEFFELISYSVTYDSLFLFVLIIGLYEITTKPSLLKNTTRIVLVGIILGILLSIVIPINDFYYGVYNTAWFIATIILFLILIRIVKYGIKKINNRKLKKASR